MTRDPSESNEEAMLGFDAREQFVPIDEDWTPDRREVFLLRRDVAKPLSADPTVWPSLFGDGLTPDERAQLKLDEFEIPDWKGPNSSLWDDVVRMRSCSGRLATLPHQTVAVTWVSVDGFRQANNFGCPKTLGPALIEADWVFMGFDIADGWLTSGLMNCGYAGADKRTVETTWSPDLNAHHLFTNLPRALAFRDVTDQRVHEHAPFFVIGLYVVPEPR